MAFGAKGFLDLKKLIDEVGFGEAMKQFFNTITFGLVDKVITMISEISDYIVNMVETAYTNVKNTLIDYVDTSIIRLKQGFEDIIDFGYEAKDIFFEKLDAIKNIGETIAENIQDFFSNLWTNMSSSFKTFVLDMAEYIPGLRPILEKNEFFKTGDTVSKKEVEQNQTYLEIAKSNNISALSKNELVNSLVSNQTKMNDTKIVQDAIKTTLNPTIPTSNTKVSNNTNIQNNLSFSAFCISKCNLLIVLSISFLIILASFNCVFVIKLVISNKLSDVEVTKFNTISLDKESSPNC